MIQKKPPKKPIVNIDNLQNDSNIKFNGIINIIKSNSITMFFVKSVYLFIYLFILTKLPRISIFLLIYATLQIRTVISQKMKYNFEARFCKIARLQDFIDNTQTHKCVT